MQIRQLLDHPHQQRLDRFSPLLGQRLERPDLIPRQPHSELPRPQRRRQDQRRIALSASSMDVNGHCCIAYATSSRSSILVPLEVFKTSMSPFRIVAFISANDHPRRSAASPIVTRGAGCRKMARMRWMRSGSSMVGDLLLVYYNIPSKIRECKLKGPHVGDAAV